MYCPSNAMKIGILGGTFNPIHAGHLALAKSAQEALGLDELWFIPTGVSYSKAQDNVLSGEERLRMVELAVKDNGKYRCLDMELKRVGYTYSYETLEQLKEQYPQHSFYFVVGADCLFTIENWKHPERIFQACTLAAAMRGSVRFTEMEAKKEQLHKQFDADIILFPFDAVDISSTEIRRRIAVGENIIGMVPEKVKDYIDEKGFYREKDIHCD